MRLSTYYLMPYLLIVLAGSDPIGQIGRRVEHGFLETHEYLVLMEVVTKCSLGDPLDNLTKHYKPKVGVVKTLTNWIDRFDQKDVLDKLFASDIGEWMVIVVR